MKQIFRVNTFETNSSSVHSMVILIDEELKKWKKGEGFVECGTFYTKEQIEEKYKSYNAEYSDGYESIEEFIRDNGYRTYDTWGENYEQDSSTYTTKSGDVVHVFCYYGQEY